MMTWSLAPVARLEVPERNASRAEPRGTVRIHSHTFARTAAGTASPSPTHLS